MSIPAACIALAFLACATRAPRAEPQPAPAEERQDPAPAPPAAEEKPARMTLQPNEGGKASPSTLWIASPLLPEARLGLVTCEAVLEKRGDLGLYVVRPQAADWDAKDGAYAYTWRIGGEVELGFRAEPGADSVLLEYTAKNISKAPLKRVQLHPCLPTAGAPEFYPGSAAQASGGRAAQQGVKDVRELWSRLFLWRDGKRFPFDASSHAKAEKHLAYVRVGAPTTNWSWWVNAKEEFDLPLVALASKDGAKTLALGFETANWASSNAGDPRACFHLFPWIGDLAPGESRSVRGRLYLIAGSPDAARERFLKDFPALAKD
jgi:hypothetical protein